MEFWWFFYGLYIEILRKNFPKNFNLKGTKIVLDCANGASYIAAPRLLKELGAKVFSIGVRPNGLNINDGCGSTRPDLLKLTVKGVCADVGVALDGDGDRVIMVDEDGDLVDGDQLLYALAVDHVEQQTLEGPVVGTVMSNLGLELALNDMGIDFRRASVGDRHVMVLLKEYGCLLYTSPSPRDRG